MGDCGLANVRFVGGLKGHRPNQVITILPRIIIGSMTVTDNSSWGLSKLPALQEGREHAGNSKPLVGERHRAA
jgi:hypothetical protein